MLAVYTRLAYRATLRRVHVHVATANLDSGKESPVGQSLMGPEGHPSSNADPCFDVAAWNGAYCADC